MEKKQDLASFLSSYGPDNPEPPEFRDSKKTKQKDALHADEEYIQGKN